MNSTVTNQAAGFDEKLRSFISAARVAQSRWAAQPVGKRLIIFRKLRALIAKEALRLAGTSADLRRRPLIESLKVELLPLAEACRFLESEAVNLLAPRRLSPWPRPLWLAGVATEIHREPLGVVLIIGPRNYPLLLPGVQLLQALAAGNAVLIKPAPGCSEPMRCLLEMFVAAGLDPSLATLLPETTEAAQTALASDIDKVVFTGSATTGEKILAQLAPRLISATMELSGSDAVLVRADADLDLTVRALTFGLCLNAGETCMAPRRVFVARSLATELEGRLARALSSPGSQPVAAQTSRLENQSLTSPAATTVNSTVSARLLPLIEEALGAGAHFVVGAVNNDGTIRAPVVLAGVSPSFRLLREDVFAPVLSLVTVGDDEEAVAHANDCPYALGASIFTKDEEAGQRLAVRLNAGVVSVNDVIVPTGDARVPFGGRARSGFGVTRGAEGLLELTAPKVVTISRSKFRPALEEPQPGDEVLFSSYLQLTHGIGWKNRAQALLQLLRQLASRRKPANKL